MTLSDDQLRALAAAPEAYDLEKKRSFSKRDGEKIRRTLCAFANDLPGSGRTGVLLLGVADDGEIVGTPATDEDLRTLIQFARDGSMQPIPTVLGEMRMIDGHPLLVMQVDPCPAAPVRWDGRIWVRTGSQTEAASRSDELALIERSRGRVAFYDQTPVRAATLADLDLTYFERVYLPAAVSEDILAENDRTTIQRLAAQGLATPDGTPTVAGLLAIGLDPRRHLPGAYVQLVCYGGPTVDAPIFEQREIGGRVSEQVVELERSLRVLNPGALQLTADEHEVRHRYPPVAIQQIVRNAVLHRRYEEETAPVRVEWFSDHVCIRSPGGPFGSARPPFEDAQAYRNPTLAAAMKYLRLCERFGHGVRKANAALERNGNGPVRFETSPDFVRATLRAPGPT
jgi:ATP-dependent DNA helicase RecG